MNSQHHTSVCPGDNHGQRGEERSCARGRSQSFHNFAKLNSNPSSTLVLSADILLNYMCFDNETWVNFPGLVRNIDGDIINAGTSQLLMLRMIHD